jgi:uncharacterized membrane protein
MPDGRDIGIFIHVLAVFALGGAISISVISLTMMRNVATVQEVRAWGLLGRLLAQYYVPTVTGFVLLLSGAYLVEETGWAWSDGWIAYSAIALVVAMAVGLFVITPRMKAIGMAAGPAPEGPVPEAVRAGLRDPVLIGATHMNALLAGGIIWNMTVRPDDVVSLVALLVAAGIGIATAYPFYQERQREAA